MWVYFPWHKQHAMSAICSICNLNHTTLTNHTAVFTRARGTVYIQWTAGLEQKLTVNCGCMRGLMIHPRQELTYCELQLPLSSNWAISFENTIQYTEINNLSLTILSWWCIFSFVFFVLLLVSAEWPIAYKFDCKLIGCSLKACFIYWFQLRYFI